MPPCRPRPTRRVLGLVLALVSAVSSRGSSQNRPRIAGGPSGGHAVAVLYTWFRHVERNELDSLRPLLSKDFQFVSSGTRLGSDAFVSMIRDLGIKDPRVTLSNVDGHEFGDFAYIVYDRDEAIRRNDRTTVVPETGTLVLIRRLNRWTIVAWTVTSPSR